MKRYILSFLLPLFGLTFAFAQAQVMFRILPSEQSDLSDQVNKNLTTKLKTAMTRNNAAAASELDVFVIEPTITVTNMESSSGTMQTITMCQGELTLVAKNTIDGAEYHSVTIPLKGTVVGDNEKAMIDMIANLKPTDSSFTKFVRIAREKIQEHYANNCAAIVSKAQVLYNAGEYKLCACYLFAISESLPCYEQASELLTLALAASKAPSAPQVIVKEVPVEVEKVVVKEVPVEVVKEVPVPTPAATPAPTPAPSSEWDVSISNDKISFKIDYVKGDWSHQYIEIGYTVVNNLDERTHLAIETDACITEGGDDVSRNFVEGGNRYINSPAGVTLKQKFYIKNLKVKETGYQILKFTFGQYGDRTNVVVKNLKINW